MHDFNNFSKICDKIHLVINWYQNFTGIAKVFHKSYKYMAEKIFSQPSIEALDNKNLREILTITSNSK